MAANPNGGSSNATLWIVLGLGVVAVIAAVAIGGGASSSGFTGLAPDPNSVASIESTAQQEIQDYNNAAAAKAQAGANAIVALAGLQEDLQKTQVQTTGATDQATIAANASVQSQKLLQQANQVIAQAQYNSADFVAQQGAQAAEVVSQNEGNAQVGVAQAGAQASETASNDAENAANTKSNDSLLGSVLGVLTLGLL